MCDTNTMGVGGVVPFVSSTVDTYGERSVLYARTDDPLVVNMCKCVHVHTLVLSQNDMLLLT